MANMDERKAQLVFEAEDNTKAGTDSVKAGLQGIAETAVDASGKAAAALDSVAKAGVETGQQLDRSTASISTSIKRVISDTQRQIATLKAEASGGGTVDIFENLISQRGANAEALKPLIGNLRTLRTELDGLRQAEQRSAVDVNYERERAAAEIARRRADATAALTQVIEQQEAAERRLAGQNAFVQSLKAQSDAIGKTKADLLELQAAQLGVSSQAAPYIAKLREQEQALTQNTRVLNAYGKTNKETAAALRQVPAQITDIFVSLQGGQAPLTVLLQQGGQLKDVFGGVVPALKGLASGVIGLINPYTLAAAAAGALAIAYYQGSQEADAYNRAIVLTGNAAGVTAAQLKTTAAAISQTVGTQGAAAEVLAQLAQTGQVAGASMQRFGEVTLKVQRDLGIAAKDTVKDFAALGESPVEASLKLTKQYGYLTAATLEQIKALQDQGKAQEAATLAQNTYATAMDTKADRLRAQLGTIERAWQAITSAAKGGWDAILNVGRAETSADRLADLQRQLEQRMNTPLAVDNPAMRASREKAIAYLKEQIGLLQSDERAQRRGAEAEAERQRVQEAGAKAFDALSKAQEKGLSKQEQLNKALKEYRQEVENLKKSNPDSALLKPEAVARGEAYIRSQFAEKGGGDRGAEGRQAELADLDAKIKAEKDYTQQLRERGIQAEKNNAGAKLSDSIQQQLNGTLSATTRTFLEQKLERAKLLETVTKDREEEEKRQKAIAKSEETLRKQIQAIYDESSAVEQQRQKLDETTAAYGKSALAVAKLTAERIKLRLAEAEGSDRFDPAYVENLRRLLAEQQKLVSSVGVAEYEKVSRATQEQTLQAQEQNDLLQLEISLIGRSEVERRKIVAAREQELKLAKELRDIEKLGLDDDQTERLKAEKREEYRQKAVNAGNKVVLDDWNKTADMISTSLTDALLRGFESGKGFAQNLRDTVANMFKTLVLRPVISAVVNPIAGAVSGVVNSALYGGASALAGGANVLSGIQGTTGILGSLGTFLGTNTVATNAALAGAIGIDSASALAAAQGASAAGGGGLAGLLSNPVTIGLGAVLALSALSKSFKGETRTGGQFGVAFDGSVTNQRRGQTYTMVGQQFDRDFTGGANVALTSGEAYRLEGDPVAQESAIRKAVAGTAKTINTLLEKYGSEAALTGFSAGLETSSKGRGGVFAGGLLSTGAAFGESGKGDNYAGTLYEAFSTNSPDFKTALENFTVDLQQATLQALQAATDLPAYVSRVIKDVKVEELGAEEVAKLLETIADLPNVLLKAAGTSRDALVQQFTEGLAKGDATKAGQDVADTLVASIEAALYTNATGKIFDVVNNGIIAPVIDAITTGASVSEALSEATVQKTIERAKAQASALSELFGNAEFTAALESIRTSVGDALGQAGGAFGYTPKFQIEATKELDDAAKAAADAAEAARKKWQDITDALLDDRAQLNIDLLRAQGQEEAALAAERLRAIEGYDAYQVALYDGNQALREQITELGKLNALRDEEKALNIEMLQARGDFAGAMALITEGMSEAQRAAYLYNDSLRKQIDVVRSISSELLPAVAKFLKPEQRLSVGYEGVADSLAKVGFSLDPGVLATASLDQIAAVAREVYNLGTTSDEARLAIIRAVSGLADLKSEAIDLAASRSDAALAAVERAAQSERETLKGIIEDVKAVFEAASTGVRALRGQVDATVKISGQQAQDFIAQALSVARTTGYLPDGKELQQAIDAATSGIDATIFATQADADYQRLVVAGRLEALSDISKDQLTEYEKAEKRLEEQVKTAKDQLNALRGIETGVGSVAEALANFGTALARETAVRGGSTPQGSAAPAIPGFVQGAGGASYDPKTDRGYQAGTGLPWNGADIRYAAQQLLEADNAKAVYDAIRVSGFTLSQADGILGLRPGEAEDWAKSVGLPVFHSGTNFVPKTGLALLERGERVIPRAFNSPGLAPTGGERFERVIEALTTQMAQLRQAVATGNSYQRRTAEAVNGNPEMPMVVELA